MKGTINVNNVVKPFNLWKGTASRAIKQFNNVGPCFAVFKHDSKKCLT